MYEENNELNENIKAYEESNSVYEEKTDNDNVEFSEFNGSVESVCKIMVMGVGGGGNNAVDRMIKENVKGAEFVAINTDLQALIRSNVPPKNRIQIGKVKTGGLGAGSFPEIGENAAEESRAEIEKKLKGVNLLFITAGMGGGTGTGAAPVIAKIAKECGCIIVAVVTKPFTFEGKKREENAKKGILNLEKYVDTLIVIPNDKLVDSLDKNVTMVDAFRLADNNLKQAICGISDLITVPGVINLDFADIKAVIEGQGVAHMGVGRAKGEKRIVEAVRQAVSSPMLETTIEGARKIILNITGDKKISIGAVTEAANLIYGVVDPSANIIYGFNTSDDLQDEVVITIIATGFIDKAERTNRLASVQPVRPVQPVSYDMGVRYETPQVQQPEPTVVVKEVEPPKVEEQPKKTKEVPPFVRKLFGKK